MSKSLYLDPKPVEEKLKVNIDMVFRHSPCALVALDVHDELNHHQEDVEISKIRVD